MVTQTSSQRRCRHRLVHTGRASAFARRRAQIWLLVDRGAEGPGHSDRTVAALLEAGTITVFRVRRAWAEQGLEAGLQTAPMDHRYNGRFRIQPAATSSWTA